LKIRPVFIYIMVIFISSLCIFYLPFFIPPTKLTGSDSYVFGFNNRIAILSVILSIFIFYWIGIKLYGKSGNLQPSLFIGSEKSKNSCVNRWVYIAFAILYSATTLIIYFITQGYWYGEEAYFIRKIEFVLMGKILYKDIEFGYGPALAYLPAYFHLIMSSFGFSLQGSYYLFYALTSLSGLAFLAYVINKFNISGKYKNVIFSAIAFTGWNETMGLNYVFIRFITPFACILFIHSMLFHNITIKALCNKLKVILLILFSIFSLFINLAISPEIGISYCLILFAYILYLIFTGFRQYIYCLILLFLIPIIFFFFPKEYLNSIINFTSGGNNFPVVPALYIIFYLFSLFYLMPLLIRGLKYGGNDSPLIITLIIFNILMVPGALSRCDSGHVFYYGLSVLILTPIILLLNHSERYTRYYIFCLILIFLCFKISYFRMSGEKAFLEFTFFATGRYLGYLPPPSYNFQKLEKYKDINIGVPIMINEGLHNYLKSKNKFQSDYFMDIPLWMAEEEFSRKIRELEENEFLLIPKGYMLLETYDDTNERKAYLRQLFLYPFNCKPQRVPFQPHVKLMEYVKSHYEIIDEVEEYYLMRKKKVLYEKNNNFNMFAVNYYINYIF